MVGMVLLYAYIALAAKKDARLGDILTSTQGTNQHLTSNFHPVTFPRFHPLSARLW